MVLLATGRGRLKTVSSWWASAEEAAETTEPEAWNVKGALVQKGMPGKE